MYQLILVIHVIIALGLIGLVLMQTSKGAGVGSSMGSGASNTVFGSQGAGSFLFKLTGIFALGFYITSLILSHLIVIEHEIIKDSAIPKELSIPVKDI